ncbi:DUF5313 family protein [Streptosporangium sp. NPDC048865]|uniref:DUF5313 family protein n=1 Tax=Streptosporangium sp. NPDC048865 TaxID=3155766 RepID=UPI00342AB8F8
MTTSDAVYERRCRLLMRVAYPPRFREFRGPELLGTLMDLAEPGQSSPTLRDGLDVLRGGLMLRLREHPPVWHWLPYRAFGRRLPWKYRWWARDDIQGRFFLERHMSCAVLGWSLFLALIQSPASFWTLPMIFSIVYLIALPFKSHARRLWLVRHEFHPDGTSCIPIPSKVRPYSKEYEIKPPDSQEKGDAGR